MKFEELQQAYETLQKENLELKDRMELIQVQHDSYDQQIKTYRQEMDVLKERNQDLVRQQSNVFIPEAAGRNLMMYEYDLMTNRKPEPRPEETITLADIGLGWNNPNYAKPVDKASSEITLDDILNDW